MEEGKENFKAKDAICANRFVNCCTACKKGRKHVNFLQAFLINNYVLNVLCTSCCASRWIEKRGRTSPNNHA